MRHFYLRALIEERMGCLTDWNAVDSLMLKALAAAEKVARYRHAQLSAISSPASSTRGFSGRRLARRATGTDKAELTKLGPILDLEIAREAAGVKNRGRLDHGELNHRAVPWRCRGLAGGRWRGFEAEASSTGARPWRRRNPPPSGRAYPPPAKARFRARRPCGHGPPTLAHGRPALGGWRFNRMSAANFPSCPNPSENRRKPSVTSAHDRLLSAHRPRRRGAGQ